MAFPKRGRPTVLAANGTVFVGEGRVEGWPGEQGATYDPDAERGELVAALWRTLTPGERWLVHSTIAGVRKVVPPGDESPAALTGLREALDSLSQEPTPEEALEAVRAIREILR